MADERKRRQLDCLRCGTPMVFLRREDIQLGRYTYFGGDMGNLLAGSLPVTMYVCPDCGHLELFTNQRPEPGASESDGPAPGIPLLRAPARGRRSNAPAAGGCTRRTMTSAPCAACPGSP